MNSGQAHMGSPARYVDQDSVIEMGQLLFSLKVARTTESEPGTTYQVTSTWFFLSCQLNNLVFGPLGLLWFIANNDWGCYGEWIVRA